MRLHSMLLCAVVLGVAMQGCMAGRRGGGVSTEGSFEMGTESNTAGNEELLGEAPQGETLISLNAQETLAHQQLGNGKEVEDLGSDDVFHGRRLLQAAAATPVAAATPAPVAAATPAPTAPTSAPTTPSPTAYSGSCHVTCKTCDGPTAWNCTACADGINGQTAHTFYAHGITSGAGSTSGTCAKDLTWGTMAMGSNAPSKDDIALASAGYAAAGCTGTWRTLSYKFLSQGGTGATVPVESKQYFLKDLTCTKTHTQSHERMKVGSTPPLYHYASFECILTKTLTCSELTSASASYESNPADASALYTYMQKWHFLGSPSALSLNCSRSSNVTTNFTQCKDCCGTTSDAPTSTYVKDTCAEYNVANTDSSVNSGCVSRELRSEEHEYCEGSQPAAAASMLWGGANVPTGAATLRSPNRVNLPYTVCNAHLLQY